MQKITRDLSYRNRYIFNLISFTLSLLVSLYLSEILLRIIFIYPVPLATYYPLQIAKSGQTLNVDQYEFITQHKYNSSGFRDNEINIKKNELKRILFLGDSFTEGFGVDENARFSDQSLQFLGNKFEGINVGQLATNPDIYFNNLQHFGIALCPDLVVMTIFVGNDFMGGRNLKKPEYKLHSTPLPNYTHNSSLISFLSMKYLRGLIIEVKNGQPLLYSRKNVSSANFWDHYFQKKVNKKFWADAFKMSTTELDSHIINFNKAIIDEIFNGRLLTGVFNEAINSSLKIHESEPYYTNDDYYKTYQYIKASHDLTKIHGINFLILVIPDINQIHPLEFQNIMKNDFNMNTTPKRFAQLEIFQNRLIKDLKIDGIEYIDPTMSLKQDGQLKYYLFDNHMNANGHSILGKLLAEKIQEINKRK